MHERARRLNAAAIRPAAAYVLYWAQMNRRADANQALDFAIELANDLALPVLFYEGLTCTYPYANDRLHRFILEGVPDTEARLAQRGIGYIFYLRRRESDPNDVLYRLAARAAAVITDDYPTFIAARHNASVAPKLDVAFYAIDASCIVPMSCFDKREYAARTIRPKIHKLLPRYLGPVPVVKPRKRFAPQESQFHTRVTAANIGPLIAACEIDHAVPTAAGITGGRRAALKQLAHFVKHGLSRYAAEANQPSAHVTSGLSPYLHFGHISALEVALAARSSAEFLEQLIVRRELAFNFARFTPRLDSLEVLPDWARQTLRRHRRDRRSYIYALDDFEQARTHDALWNATQRELLTSGTIHGYYRMYWGKKIVEWSAAPEEALATMIHLHDRYALDGQDPNTYANILWCLGLHDRPWPERPIFGTVRSMSRAGMERKTDVQAYLREIDCLERTGKELAT